MNLDLSRTAEALRTYDQFDEDVISKISWDTPYSVAEKWQEHLEHLGENVGYMFGLETSDRNNVDDCRRLIRPGPKNPPKGSELSFVRRMVAKWEEEKTCG